MKKTTHPFFRFPVRSLFTVWLSVIAIVGCQTSTSVAAATQESLVVNDVTKLNPIAVAAVVVPHTLDEIINTVKNAPGKVSIGGGRFSMGGQTALEGATQIDMREYNKILDFSAERKEIHVQAGATWRKIQEYIDPYNLSVKVMQTYSDFTVGGALSVNAHGRYIGLGPVVLSVKDIGLVLANGDYVRASPMDNSELFYGAIGGYGGIGVITDATLELSEDVHVHRISKVMPLKDYKAYFTKEIRENPDIIFHNADIYPDAYHTVDAISYEKTDKPVTVPERLIPSDRDYSENRRWMKVVADMPGGKMFRQHILDPFLLHDDRTEWRNYEASYSVAELEPTSRDKSTYVLQEYFVPIDRLDIFVPQMAKILNDHHVNVINISIRHAKQDPGTLLAWAKQEVFAYVLYYKQGTSQEDRLAVGEWTRELIDAAIKNNGRYYLPYQIHATEAQFKAAYPGWEKYFALKKKVDPDNKFSNKLLDAYYTGHETEAMDDVPNSVRAKLDTMKDYRRPEAQTFLTLPEWFLVYSPDEYANYIDKNKPSGYPYFGSIGQFWGYYRDSSKAASQYPFNGGYHLMVSVIGTSFTVENGAKGIYENSIGRLSEFTETGNQATEEDRYATEMAKNYVEFIRINPWYEYGFWTKFKGVWTEPPLIGHNMIRKWERKFALSTEYLVKAGYGGVIKLSTKLIYGDADDHLYAVVRHLPTDHIFTDPNIKVISRFDDDLSLVSLPRYEAFLDADRQLIKAGASFVEIAGNKTILATVIANQDWRPTGPQQECREVYERPILTEPGRKRVGLALDVRHLHEYIPQFDSGEVALEHIYDY